jgi:hypothetical protein
MAEKVLTPKVEPKAVGLHGLIEDFNLKVPLPTVQAMKKKKISKSRMAAQLKTSRTQVDRLLDPKNDITLSSLQRAAAMVGRRVSIELV